MSPVRDLKVLLKALLGCPDFWMWTTVILFFDLELCFSDLNVNMGLFTKQESMYLMLYGQSHSGKSLKFCLPPYRVVLYVYIFYLNYWVRFKNHKISTKNSYCHCQKVSDLATLLPAFLCSSYAGAKASEFVILISKEEAWLEPKR